MPGTRSRIARRWPDLAWGAFAAVNLAVMVRWHDWQTVPFHFVWVSLTLLYGFRAWRRGSTAAVLAVVTVTTGYALARTVQITGDGLDELTEVPLMLAMFLAMMWHADRRDVALEQVRRSAEREREFIRDASHLLRTPITIARGHAELLVAGADGQAREDADVVVGELKRLSRISDRLLMLAASDHAQFTSVRALCLRSLLDATVQRWAAAAPRNFVADVAADGHAAGRRGAPRVRARRRHRERSQGDGARRHDHRASVRGGGLRRARGHRSRARASPRRPSPASSTASPASRTPTAAPGSACRS